MPKKYESAFDKAKRYQSELETGFYCKNGMMVPVDEERRSYCEGFIGEVRCHAISNDKNAPAALKQRQSGSQAAANLLRKEYKFKKNADEKKIVNNALNKKNKRNKRFKNAVDKAVQKELAKKKKK